MHLQMRAATYVRICARADVTRNVFVCICDIKDLCLALDATRGAGYLLERASWLGVV